MPKKNCTHPQATYAPSPTYFYDRGTATISVLVDEKGTVHDPQLVWSSGSKGYDRDAVRTIRKWRFHPSLCDGKPSPIRIAIEFRTASAH